MERRIVSSPVPDTTARSPLRLWLGYVLLVFLPLATGLFCVDFHPKLSHFG